MARPRRPAIHVIRAPVLRHYVSHLRGMGVPVDRLLAKAGIPAELLGFADTLVPLSNGFHFLELACSALGTEHAGLRLGLESSLVDFGDYGQDLACSPTVDAYLRRGVRFYNRLNSGERLWLSRESGADLRVNMMSSGDFDLGAYQSHLCTLVVTILTLRQAAGADWCPLELGLAYRPRETLPLAELLAGTRIVHGTGHSYITLPSSLRHLRFPRTTRSPARADRPPGKPLPTDLLEIVMSQIETLYTNGSTPHVDTVAESLSMSRRTLQREIARRGTTYCNMLHRSRTRKACDWLDHSDKSITEIAFELGYTDASNFTRAFRRDTGLSPSAFRRQVTAM